MSRSVSLTKFRNLGMDFRVRGRKRSSVPVSSPCKGLCQFTGRNSTLKNKIWTIRWGNEESSGFWRHTSKSILRFLPKFICLHLLSFMLKNKIASKQGYNSLEKMLKQSYFEKSDSFVETQSAMACT